LEGNGSSVELNSSVGASINSPSATEPAGQRRRGLQRNF
jgi:hypothetical protein